MPKGFELIDKMLSKIDSKNSVIVDKIKNNKLYKIEQERYKRVQKLEELKSGARQWANSVSARPDTIEHKFLLKLKEDYTKMIIKSMQKDGQKFYNSSLAGKVEIINMLLRQPEKIAKELEYYENASK